MEHEHDLIREIINGKSELFEQIVRQYQNLVYTICLSIVRDRHEAENMAQETFLSAYSSLSGYHGGDFKSWLCKIAANKSIDYKRKQLRFFAADEHEIDRLEAREEDSAEWLFEQSERKERLDGVLTSIPGKYSTVIKEFYYGQLPVKEIARRLKLPEKTVETRLYRAKKLIRERWGEDGI